MYREDGGIHVYTQACLGIAVCSRNSATVGWGMTSYTIQEDGVMIYVCAEVFEPDLPCPALFPFNVTFTTDDDSAGIIIT